MTDWQILVLKALQELAKAAWWIAYALSAIAGCCIGWSIGRLW